MFSNDIFLHILSQKVPILLRRKEKKVCRKLYDTLFQLVANRIISRLLRYLSQVLP